MDFENLSIKNNLKKLVLFAMPEKNYLNGLKFREKTIEKDYFQLKLKIRTRFLYVI